MTYLLDTNTCIGWLRQNQPQIVARIQAQSQANIVLCSVVVGELMCGVEQSDYLSDAQGLGGTIPIPIICTPEELLGDETETGG